MNYFYEEKAVDFRNRKSMVDFLKNHFRYNTMNSWNGLTSYANNVKIYNLGLTNEQENYACDILSCDSADTLYDEIGYICDNFFYETGYKIYSNGRSGGYLVLYRAETYNGIDQDEDFEDWDMSELKERVKLVQAFDKACDRIRETFIYCLDNSMIVDQDYTVTKKVLVLSEEV